MNDILDIINDNKNYTFKKQGDFEIKADDKEYVFYLRVKDKSKINKDIIFTSKDNMILTTNIKFSDIDLENVLFYAKAK